MRKLLILLLLMMLTAAAVLPAAQASEDKICALEYEFEALCQQKGGFFTWSLEDKAAYAESLPDKLAQAYASGKRLLSDVELEAIANYGFCLPPEDCLTQQQACDIATAATAEAFGLEPGWESAAEVYYSFFQPEGQQYTWRVIFWKTGIDAYPSGLVDLDAITGQILRVEKNGTTPNAYISIQDRL